MVAILNEKREIAASGHKTEAEAKAWILWAHTVRPDAEYVIISDEEFDRIFKEAKAATEASAETVATEAATEVPAAVDQGDETPTAPTAPRKRGLLPLARLAASKRPGPA